MTRVAAYAWLRDEDRVLLCRLSQAVNDRAGMWTLPGGGIEFGEHPEAAMVREVEEETGLIVTPQGLRGIYTFTKEDPAECFQSVQIVYNAKIQSGELRHELDGTTDRCDWQLLDFATLPVVELVRAAITMQ